MNHETRVSKAVIQVSRSEIQELMIQDSRFKKHDCGGQSLVEVLVAVAVGIILIVGAIALITPALKINTDVVRSQVAGALGKELLENVRVFAESSWHNVADLSTSSANHYYLNATTSPFAAVSGDESVTVATTTYTRYFFVEEVSRNSAGKIVTSGGSNDPATRKITVVYRQPQSASRTLGVYLVRGKKNNIFRQTDWSGGAGQDGPATTTNNRFSTSSKIDFTTTTGSIIIKF